MVPLGHALMRVRIGSALFFGLRAQVRLQVAAGATLLFGRGGNTLFVSRLDDIAVVVLARRFRAAPTRSCIPLKM